MHEAMNRITTGLAGLAGLGIGTVFFGGLWWTVRQGVTSKRPALLFTGSMVARMGFALTGFYFVSAHHWERAVACLIGFVAARMAVRMTVEKLAGPKSEPQSAETREAGSAA